jgi:hypothetical protein
MSNELDRLLKALDKQRFDIDGLNVTCWFGTKGESPRHSVRLREVDGEIRMEATVATARTLDAISEHEDPHKWAWRRNRVSNLVGFRIDSQRRLIAEAVAPMIGLADAEFVTYLLAVSAEADRMELVFTAQDVQ